MSDESEWKPVVLRKNPTAKPSSQAGLAKAKASGVIETVARPQHTAPPNAKRLDDNEADTFRHASIPQEFKLALQKARQTKGLTQAQLAQQMNLQVSVVNSYEKGTAVPDGQIIQKL